MKEEINKIAEMMGVSGTYKTVPILCPYPCFAYGIPGFAPCEKEKCNGYVTQRLLTPKEKEDMSLKKDTIVPTRYCKSYEMDLPVILERVRV